MLFTSRETRRIFSMKNRVIQRYTVFISFLIQLICSYLIELRLISFLEGHNETLEDGENTMALLAAPIRIIAHPHAKSFVWQHFGFVPLGDSDTPDRRRVLCRLCLRELPYCGNTTNLQYHLQRYFLINKSVESSLS